MRAVRRNQFGRAQRRSAAKDDDIEQRVGTEPIGAMNRNTGGFADRHQTRHDGVRIAVLQGDDFAVIIGRYTPHVVVHGRQNRNRFLGDVDAGKNLRRLGNPRQALVDDFGTEMLEVQMNVIALRADPAPLVDLDRHRTADYVARGQVLGVRRVALHEPLSFRIGQITALAAHPFGNQYTGAVDSGWMKLNEFHILQRQTGAHDHRIAVACAGMRRGRGKIGSSATAGGEHDQVRAETMQFTGRQIPGNHSAANPVFHDQVDREILDVKLGLVFE